MRIFYNINLLITRNCNLKCAHCLRGEGACEDISPEVLRKLFVPGTMIQHLQLNGGEVFSRPNVLRQIIEEIIRNNVLVLYASIPTNGTLYTKEIEILLVMLNEYIKACHEAMGDYIKRGVEIDISRDQYHTDELMKIKDSDPDLYNTYLTNIGRAIHSPFFNGARELNVLVNAGRAKNLKEDKIDPIHIKTFYLEHETIYGPVVEISNIGIDNRGTLCSTCGKMPATGACAYGNILFENIEDIIRRIGIRCNNEDELLNHYQKEIGRIQSKML